MPFRDIVGHRHLTSLLARAVARGTMPPTLLLAGPAGVGKWRVARAIAAAVNCPAPVEGDACGACRSCDRIARGIHVDVLALQADDTGKIKVEVARAALEECGFRPFEGQRRVVLVRDADALVEAAQNALLKSLEEPPPATVFVLTSAAPDALLRTVRSRTMRLTFGRLPVDDLVRVLVRDHAMEEADARRVAVLADGSPGAALALGTSALGDTREGAAMLLGASGAADLAGRLAIAKAVFGEKKAERTRQQMLALLHLASSLVRDVAALHAGADRRLLANGDMGDALDRLACTLQPAAARQAFATLDRGLHALERNAGAKLVVEWISSEI
ncbi:MAG: AAA family ATPase [Acidobacteria bacterium]|nr:AAA family ATPase [Acidobacteriota bacterium]